MKTTQKYLWNVSYTYLDTWNIFLILKKNIILAQRVCTLKKWARTQFEQSDNNNNKNNADNRGGSTAVHTCLAGEFVPTIKMGKSSASLAIIDIGMSWNWSRSTQFPIVCWREVILCCLLLQFGLVLLSSFMTWSRKLRDIRYSRIL